MRTLKYRAYIKPLKRYAEKYETILCHHQCNMEPSWTVNISPEEYYGDEDLVIEQLTGLLDRNGKEIYEGDIVEWLNGLGDYIRFTVEWQNNRAKFCLRNEHSSYDYEGLDDKKKPYIEVIGNMHETQNCLEVKNEAAE